jgi:hypothetical protein
LPNLQRLAEKEELTKYQMQVRNWDYQGWSDTKFVKPEDFGTMIDLPRFYETIPWAHNGDQNSDNPEEAKK